MQTIEIRYNLDTNKTQCVSIVSGKSTKISKTTANAILSEARWNDKKIEESILYRDLFRVTEYVIN